MPFHFSTLTATRVESGRARAARRLRAPIPSTSHGRGRVLVLALVALALFATTVPVTASAAPVTLPFPRLGMWWPNSDTQPVSARGRYDFIGLQNHDANHIAELRAFNPDIYVLGSTNARELNYRLNDYNDPLNVELRSASTEWMLTQAGSTLASGITNTATSIPVASGARFAAGEMVLVDSELMYVNSVSGATLNVTRGQVTPRASHANGARIAPVVSVWSGAIEFDLTGVSRKADVGAGLESWAQWNARRGKRVLDSADWDGLLIDCFDPNPGWMIDGSRNRSVDTDRDNVPDDLAAFTTAWNDGLVTYGDALRAAVGAGKILLPNSGGRDYNLNGNNIESFPKSDTSLNIWNRVIIGPYAFPHAPYLDYTRYAQQPNLTTIQTYDIDGTLPSGWNPATFVPNYQKMRYGLTTALMGDGFFSYEISMNGHGALGLLWFDEYDNAGKKRGYLGQPTGDARPVGSNVWRRDYEGGIVLVNPDTTAHTVDLGGLFRKIQGTQAPSVNDGSLATAVTLQGRDGIVLLRDTSPGTTPAAHVPLYRFFNVKTGTHFYTASDSEKNSVIANLGTTYSFEGVAYYVSQIGADAVPVYRFYNGRSGTHFYTASGAEKDSVIARLGTVYSYEGVAFYASATQAGAIPIFRFYNGKSGTHFYTASDGERDNVIRTLGTVFSYEGAAYYAWVR